MLVIIIIIIIGIAIVPFNPGIVLAIVAGLCAGIIEGWSQDHPDKESQAKVWKWEKKLILYTVIAGAAIIIIAIIKEML